MTHRTRRPSLNKKRQAKAAKNLAKGMSTQEALVEAGYSESYAASKGYRAVKLPAIQSIFTESCQRIMAKRHLEFDQLLEPYFEALTAKVIVRSTQLGDAQEGDLPDHPLRMSAADRLVQLFGGGKSAEKPEPERGGGETPGIPLSQFAHLSLDEQLAMRQKLLAVFQEVAGPRVVNG